MEKSAGEAGQGYRLLQKLTGELKSAISKYGKGGQGSATQAKVSPAAELAEPSSLASRLAVAAASDKEANVDDDFDDVKAFQVTKANGKDALAKWNGKNKVNKRFFDWVKESLHKSDKDRCCNDNVHKRHPPCVLPLPPHTLLRHCAHIPGDTCKVALVTQVCSLG